MDNLLNTILKDTYTLSHLKKRLRVLRAYLLHRFFSPDSKDKDSFKGVDLTVSDLSWIYSLGTDFTSQFNKDNIYDKLQELEDQAKKLPNLTVYLAFEPNEEAVRLIGQFLRNQFSHDLMCEFKIDPSLIGGCSLVWKGVYKDYSVKDLINQKKEDILTSFKTYLRK